MLEQVAGTKGNILVQRVTRVMERNGKRKKKVKQLVPGRSSLFQAIAVMRLVPVFLSITLSFSFSWLFRARYSIMVQLGPGCFPLFHLVPDYFSLFQIVPCISLQLLLYFKLLRFFFSLFQAASGCSRLFFSNLFHLFHFDPVYCTLFHLVHVFPHCNYTLLFNSIIAANNEP